MMKETVMDEREIKFHCSKCGKLLFIMEYSFKPEMKANGEIILHPIINFIPKRVETSYMSVVDEVRISPCYSCEDEYHSITSESIAEEIQVPIEVTLKETMKSVTEILKKTEEWDDMLGDTLRELYNSISSLEKAGPKIRDITKQIKEKLQKTYEEVIEEIEGFKVR